MTVSVETAQDIRGDLLDGRKQLGIWGLGFIGYSSMANFATKGVLCIGTDIDKRKVDSVNSGGTPVENIEYWLGFNPKPLSMSGTMRATTEWKQLLSPNVAVHLICVPTERNDKPHLDILADVLTKIANSTTSSCPPLVIIESTLTPGTVSNMVIPLLRSSGLYPGRDILIGVAPRRDWFADADKSLKTLPRVVGGTTPETTKLMRDVLGIVCNTVLPAKDHKHAELVKSVENAYRHVEITLANQLSLAYPEIDMREVLALVGTKWNIGTFCPSFGTGGYCIPLSSLYVLDGAPKADELSILQATIDTDRGLPGMVGDLAAAKSQGHVGILGLAYKEDLKVHVLSPTLAIVAHLKTAGISVKVNDPYYSADEIRGICDTESFDFPGGLSEFDTVLVVAGHRQYQSVNRARLLECLGSCRTIIDNTGIWQDIDFSWPGIDYRLAGKENWLR